METSPSRSQNPSLYPPPLFALKRNRIYFYYKSISRLNIVYANRAQSNIYRVNPKYTFNFGIFHIVSVERFNFHHVTLTIYVDHRECGD